MPAVQRQPSHTDAKDIIQQCAIKPTSTANLARQIFNQIDPDARFVLIGEASHGTHEFYQVRAEITKYLMAERGFQAAVVEADFPDAFKANLWVKGHPQSESENPDEALDGFLRFPTWMWRNTVMVDFLNWLKEHNETLPVEDRAGFYGMDVYSLHSSARQVIDFLQSVDPKAAERAAARYACFDRYGEDSQKYAMAVGLGHAPSCANEAIANLVDVIRKHAQYSEISDGFWGRELSFQAKANAAVVVDAEKYYRNMYFGEELSWNLRDMHFLDAVRMIVEHLESVKPHNNQQAKLVLWAHNSHLGDAAATDMGKSRGEINIGQLMRETYGRDACFNIGFTTHHGTVTAAHEWESPGMHMSVRKSMPGSYENAMHSAEIPEFALKLKNGNPDLLHALQGPMLERAIGVIYRPRSERQSHYFYAELPEQFDLVAHIDHTTALHPLEPHPEWLKERKAKQDLPETYPFGV